MDRDALVELLGQNLSQRQLADTLGCSQTTVKYWLNKWGLNTKYSRVDAKYCRRCGENDTTKLRSGCRYICKRCDTQRTLDRFRLYKTKAVEYKGGKCVVCGYDRCLAALDFHHLDPKDKDPDWNLMKNRAFEGIKRELDKCVLVCNRCHVEAHQGLIVI